MAKEKKDFGITLEPREGSASKKTWLQAEVETLAELYNENKTAAEISAVVGHPVNSVRYMIRKLQGK